MEEIFLINAYGPTNLCHELSHLRDEFDNIFWTNANGSMNLVTYLTEAQQAYHKLLQIGATAYPDDKSCMEAILNGLTAYEFVLANLILMGGRGGGE